MLAPRWPLSGAASVPLRFLAWPTASLRLHVCNSYRFWIRLRIAEATDRCGSVVHFVYTQRRHVFCTVGVGLSTRSPSLRERTRWVNPPFSPRMAMPTKQPLGAYSTIPPLRYSTQGAVHFPIRLMEGALDPLGDRGWERRAKEQKQKKKYAYMHACMYMYM